MKKAEIIKDFLIITFGTLIVSAAVFFFLIPSQVSVGSISGLAMILGNVIPLPISVITFVLNASLLVIGFLLIGKEFGVKTVYTSLLLPAYLMMFEVCFPKFTSINEDPFLDTVCYIFLVSIGLAILFKRNASSGGLDIVAKLLNQYLRMDMGKAMALPGMCVSLSSILFYDKKLVILSVLGTYLNGIVLDHFIFGMDQKKRICIISEKETEIRAFILHNLHSGATIYQSFGAYNNEPKTEIITIVDKNEYALLMSYILKTDPQAFVTVYTVSEVIYRPKRKNQ